MVRLLIYIYITITITITITESRVLARLRPTDLSRHPPSAVGALLRPVVRPSLRVYDRTGHWHVGEF